jgi:hypothetical protein
VLLDAVGLAEGGAVRVRVRRHQPRRDLRVAVRGEELAHRFEDGARQGVLDLGSSASFSTF